MYNLKLFQSALVWRLCFIMNTNSRISYPYLNGCNDLLKLGIKHTEYAINAVIRYGYTREEAINILDGKNADGSAFIELPF